MLFLYFFAWVLLGVVTSHFAEKRGRNPKTWFLIGMFFGLLGLLVLFLLPSFSVPTEQIKPSPSNLTLPLAIADVEDTQWFYINDSKKQQGPISFTIIKDMVLKKELTDRSYVWCEGMDQWNRIESIAEL